MKITVPVWLLWLRAQQTSKQQATVTLNRCNNNEQPHTTEQIRHKCQHQQNNTSKTGRGKLTAEQRRTVVELLMRSMHTRTPWRSPRDDELLHRAANNRVLVNVNQGTVATSGEGKQN